MEDHDNRFFNNQNTARFILLCNGLQNVYSSKAMNTNDKRRKNSFTEIFKKNLDKYKFENNYVGLLK